jgi:hypothetical protein
LKRLKGGLTKLNIVWRILAINSLLVACHAFAGNDTTLYTPVSNSTDAVIKNTTTLDIKDYNFWGFTEVFKEADNYNVFAEYRVTRKLYNTISLQVEFNDINGSDNELYRLGLVNDFKYFTLRFFPLESDNEGYQISAYTRHDFTEKIIGEIVIDYDAHDSAADDWFIEPELTYLINDILAVKARYTYNDYSRDRNAVSAGISIRF